MTTTEEDTGSGNGVSSSTVGESGSGACVVGGSGGSVSGGVSGGVIMENLIEKSLYDIGDPDLMDVWDTDLNAVSKKGRHEVAKVDAPTRRKRCCSTAVLHLSFWVPVACTRYQAELKR